MGKLSTESAFSEYHRADFSINVACGLVRISRMVVDTYTGCLRFLEILES